MATNFDSLNSTEFARSLATFLKLPPQPQREVLEQIRNTLFPTPANFALIVEQVASGGWFKRCSRCRKQKAETEFYRDRTKPDGYTYRCKSCVYPEAYG